MTDANTISAKHRTRTVRVTFSRAIVDKFYADGGILPLEVLMMTMRQAWREKNYDLAREIAAEAAPFLHPKMAAIEIATEDGSTRRVVELPAVVESIDEWRRLYGPRTIEHQSSEAEHK